MMAVKFGIRCWPLDPYAQVSHDGPTSLDDSAKRSLRSTVLHW